MNLFRKAAIILVNQKTFRPSNPKNRHPSVSMYTNTNDTPPGATVQRRQGENDPLFIVTLAIWYPILTASGILSLAALVAWKKMKDWYIPNTILKKKKVDMRMMPLMNWGRVPVIPALSSHQWMLRNIVEVSHFIGRRKGGYEWFFADRAVGFTSGVSRV